MDNPPASFDCKHQVCLEHGIANADESLKGMRVIRHQVGLELGIGNVHESMTCTRRIGHLVGLALNSSSVRMLSSVPGVVAFLVSVAAAL